MGQAQKARYQAQEAHLEAKKVRNQAQEAYEEAKNEAYMRNLEDNYEEELYRAETGDVYGDPYWYDLEFSDSDESGYDSDNHYIPAEDMRRRQQRLDQVAMNMRLTNRTALR